MIAFINLNGQGPTSEKDKQLLDLALEQTESQLRGFLTALDQDKELCVRSQRSFSGLNEPELSQVQIKLETLYCGRYEEELQSTLSLKNDSSICFKVYKKSS